MTSLNENFSGRPSSGRFLAPSKAQSPMKTAPARSRAEDKFSYTGRAEICDRYGADKRSRNSALLASYLAAARLPSEPSMTVLPSVVDTYHLHFRPRLFTTTSKTGNRQSIARRPHTEQGYRYQQQTWQLNQLLK